MTTNLKSWYNVLTIKEEFSRSVWTKTRICVEIVFSVKNFQFEKVEKVAHNIFHKYKSFMQCPTIFPSHDCRLKRHTMQWRQFKSRLWSTMTMKEKTITTAQVFTYCCILAVKFSKCIRLSSVWYYFTNSKTDSQICSRSSQASTISRDESFLFLMGWQIKCFL